MEISSAWLISILKPTLDLHSPCHWYHEFLIKGLYRIKTHRIHFCSPEFDSETKRHIVSQIDEILDDCFIPGSCYLCWTHDFNPDLIIDGEEAREICLDLVLSADNLLDQSYQTILEKLDSQFSNLHLCQSNSDPLIYQFERLTI